LTVAGRRGDREDMLRTASLATMLLIGGCSSAPVAGDARADDARDDRDAASPADDASAPLDTNAAPGDLDHDGLLDADELRIASEYLPFLSISDADACARNGILFRMRPHPDDATRLAVTMIVLYETDCGAGGHVGDDEVFGMTLDPSRPAPDGILAIRTIAHQNTACELVTDCGAGCGLDACTMGSRRGAAYPAIFASRDKHGWYAHEAQCDNACFFTNQCDMASAGAEPMLLNAGEPGAMLVTNLTTAGLITAANGWTEATLFDFDPWADMDFGGAGNTTSDLVDAAFLTPVCP
jgi:hypothetical protein